METFIHWESQPLSKSSMTAYLDVLREACRDTAHVAQLNCSPATGELLRSKHATISLNDSMGLNVINPTDLTGGGTLELPRDLDLLLALVAISNTFHQTFRLENEPQIQFCDAKGRELLPQTARRWPEIADVLHANNVPGALITKYRLDLAISLGLAAEPLDIRSDRMPDAFF